MLSILIPIYNFEVTELVQVLHQQGLQLPVPFEIILVDDASTNLQTKRSNQLLPRLEFVTLHELENNIGRAKIRNYLAQLAQYDFLVYMDGDSMPVDTRFLERYYEHLNSQKVLCGGRTYQVKQPHLQALLLHWKYGSNREATTAAQRSIAPHRSFMTNNFVVPKAIILQFPFDESITQYGHEDTLFGLALEQSNIQIEHLDNPLEHIDIEIASVFLSKTARAIQNLWRLHLQYDLTGKVKLLNYYLWCRKWRIAGLVYFVYQLLAPLIQRNLKSSNPNLYLFDVYKLALLIKIAK